MRYLLLCALAACATSEAKTPDDLSIVLSSVTLADDCPSPAPVAPPQGFAKPPPATAPVARDGALASGATVQASFQLKSPDWGKLGGRFKAQDRTFQLRVVVTVGGSDHTIEKTAIIPAHIEPAVVT